MSTHDSSKADCHQSFQCGRYSDVIKIKNGFIPTVNMNQLIYMCWKKTIRYKSHFFFLLYLMEFATVFFQIIWSKMKNFSNIFGKFAFFFKSTFVMQAHN